MDDPRVGKLVHQPVAEHQRTPGAFDPDAVVQAPAQPLEQVPEVGGGWLPGLAHDHRLQLVEQRLGPLAEMRQHNPHDGRHVVPAEAGAGGVEGVEHLVGVCTREQPAACRLPAVRIPHPAAGDAAEAEGPHPDAAEELGQAEDARMAVQDVRHHRRAAAPGAQHEHR